MKQTKIKFAATTVFTVNGGIETDAIVSDGNLFVKVADISAFGIGSDTNETQDDPPAKTTPTAKTDPAKPAAAPTTKKPAGKASTLKAVPETPEADDDMIDLVIGILTDLDQGQNNEKKATERLLALEGVSEDASAKQVRAAIDAFVIEPTSDMAEVAGNIVKLLQGEEPAPAAEPEAKPVKKAATTAKKTVTKKSEPEPEPEPEEDGEEGEAADPEVVEISDLEEGDDVAVWFAANDEWFMGVVTKVTKKGVTVKYEDDNEELVIDPEVHTEIQRYPKSE